MLLSEMVIEKMMMKACMDDDRYPLMTEGMMLWRKAR